jgi:DNA ligase 1
VSQYPDVISLVECIFERSPQTMTFIMDSEIVALDPADGSIKSFQELSNRARKDVKLSDIKVAVGVFAFDLMYLDGEVTFVASEIAVRSLLLRLHRPSLNNRSEREGNCSVLDSPCYFLRT